jgi:DNA-binding CsgD family transcriptional regulator
MPDLSPRELSMREREILAAAARGLGVTETGRQLYLSPNTVKTYRRTAFRVLGARNVTEAVALAQASGLLQPEAPEQRSPVVSGSRAR